MRLTGGTLRSRRVAAPKGRAVRPTPARVKEALFSIIADRIPDARVLDLFAGSGALGFEALSRGAAHVTFVEQHAPTAHAIRRTAQTLGVEGRFDVVVGAAERIASRLHGRYDVVFADPPYAAGLAPLVLSSLADAGLVDACSLVVYEHSAKTPPPTHPRFANKREAVYGAVALSFLEPYEHAHG